MSGFVTRGATAASLIGTMALGEALTVPLPFGFAEFPVPALRPIVIPPDTPARYFGDITVPRYEPPVDWPVLVTAPMRLGTL